MDIDEAVEKGEFRRDLLARIKAFVKIPPLRERLGDVIMLAKHFADKHKLSDRCRLALLRYDWPENVRELKNRIEIAITRRMSTGSSSVDIEHLDLPPHVIDSVKSLSNDECQEELWKLADRIARDEGYDQGTGLQKRVAEILGVSEPQASKMYKSFGLQEAQSA